MFSVLSSRTEHKKTIENRKPVYFFYIMIFFNFYPFLGIFAALRPSFKYFYKIFRGSEVFLKRCDSYGNFCYLKKSNIFILREFNKITHCFPGSAPLFCVCKIEALFGAFLTFFISILCII